MSGPFKENWKRLSNRYRPNTQPTAMDPKDILRFEDAALIGGSGIHRVTNLTSPSSPGSAVAPGGNEAVFDLVIIRVSGDYDVILPEAPLVGKRYDIKDGAGDGFTSSKNIIPSGFDTIEGLFNTFPLSNNFQSWSLVYAGGNIWRLV